MESDGSPVEHIAVLSRTLAEQITLPQDAVMVDATIGHGGHSLLFGQFLGPEAILIGFDVDPNCLKKAQHRLEDLSCRVELIHSNFSHIRERLTTQGISKVDFLLADLGVCSAQLTDIDLGLSFQTNMPLDMRIDKRLITSAADIVNRYDRESLADLIYAYGQDRASRRIARFIVQERKSQPIRTTGRLADIVCKALGQRAAGRRSRIHPATRTFQALRIAVNGEMENLERLLDDAPNLLSRGGRIAVISFHSLEDRMVKLSFKENKARGVYSEISKKPLLPGCGEIAENARARSAKLRIAQKQ